MKDKKEEETVSKMEEEIDIDLTDPEVDKAATKIQAGFRGQKVRKEMKDKKEEEEAASKREEEEIDIDLTDPEVEKAATKIQAGFRGQKVRKEMKDKKRRRGCK